MLEIIKEAEYATKTEHERKFWSKKYNCVAYSFPCSKEGVIQFLCEGAKKSYEDVVKDTDEFEDLGIVKHSYDIRIPAEGRCACGNIVVLENQYQGTCECGKCGRWYNLFGQELLNPAEWEEDW